MGERGERGAQHRTGMEKGYRKTIEEEMEK